MEERLKEFLTTSTGCALEELIAAELPIKPDQVQSLHVYADAVYSIVAKTDVKNPKDDSDFKAVICYAHLSEKALQMINEHDRLGLLYCLWLTRLYGKDIPFAIEKAIIESEANALLKKLSKLGHRWSKSAREIMKESQSDVAKSMSVVMPYYDTLPYFTEKKVVSRFVYYDLDHVSEGVYGDFIDRGFLDWHNGSGLQITEKGLAYAKEVENFYIR